MVAHNIVNMNKNKTPRRVTLTGTATTNTHSLFVAAAAVARDNVNINFRDNNMGKLNSISINKCANGKMNGFAKSHSVIGVRNNSWSQIPMNPAKMSTKRVVVQFLMMITIVGPLFSLLYFFDTSMIKNKTNLALVSGPCSLRDDIFDDFLTNYNNNVVDKNSAQGLVSGNSTNLTPESDFMASRQGIGLCPPDPKASGSNMDVVGLALKATCVNVRAVLSLNHFLSPRRIFIITTSETHCRSWTRVASNVVCLDEDNVIPSLTKEVVGEYLKNRFNEDGSSVHKGRDLSGWYFQQLLKLGAARHIPDLSNHFLIWDLDMVMLKPMEFFDKPVQVFGNYGMSEDDEILNQQIPLISRKATGTVDFDQHSQQQLQQQKQLQVEGSGLPQTIRPIRVHIGGKINEHSYDIAYKRLFGKDIKYADDGSSFVTHHMIVYKPYMEEFLNSLADADVGKNEFTETQMQHLWAVKILESINEKRIELGFSEYQSYISFVLDRYPQSMKVLKRKMWERNPIMYSTRAHMLSPFYPLRILCCPSASQLVLMRWLGYEYVGVEMGHMESCKLHEDLTPSFLKAD